MGNAPSCDCRGAHDEALLEDFHGNVFLKVRIISAEGLTSWAESSHYSSSGHDLLYAVCKSESVDCLTETKGVPGCADPTWRHSGERVRGWQIGQSLLFEVRKRPPPLPAAGSADRVADGDELLGSATLAGDRITSLGFQGELPLTGSGMLENSKLLVEVILCTKRAATEYAKKAQFLSKALDIVQEAGLARVDDLSREDYIDRNKRLAQGLKRAHGRDQYPRIKKLYAEFQACAEEDTGAINDPSPFHAPNPAVTTEKRAAAIADFVETAEPPVEREALLSELVLLLPEKLKRNALFNCLQHLQREHLATSQSAATHSVSAGEATLQQFAEREEEELRKLREMAEQLPPQSQEGLHSQREELLKRACGMVNHKGLDMVEKSSGRSYLEARRKLDLDLGQVLAPQARKALQEHWLAFWHAMQHVSSQDEDCKKHADLVVNHKLRALGAATAPKGRIAQEMAQLVLLMPSEGPRHALNEALTSRLNEEKNALEEVRAVLQEERLRQEEAAAAEKERLRLLEEAAAAERLREEAAASERTREQLLVEEAAADEKAPTPPPEPAPLALPPPKVPLSAPPPVYRSPEERAAPPPPKEPVQEPVPVPVPVALPPVEEPPAQPAPAASSAASSSTLALAAGGLAVGGLAAGGLALAAASSSSEANPEPSPPPAPAPPSSSGVAGGRGSRQPRGSHQGLAIQRADNVRRLPADPGQIHVAKAHAALATAYRNTGKLQDALEQQQKALAVRQANVGDLHADTAVSYTNVAAILRLQGNLDDAYEHYQQAKEIRSETLGAGHPDTAASYASLGSIELQRGYPANALEMYQRALEITRDHYGEWHPETATRYNEVGTAHEANGELEKALQNLWFALQIQVHTIGDHHAGVGDCYNNVGAVLWQLNRLEEALEYHFRALEIRHEVLGERHSDTALSYGNVGVIHEQMGNLDDALRNQMMALQIRREVLTENHTETCASHINCGIVLQRQGKYREAKEHFKEALQHLEVTVGRPHPWTQQARQHLQRCEAAERKRG